MAKRQKKQWFKRGVWWRKIRLNRKHKDRLFRYLFQDKKYLLDLYNALHDSSYTNPDALEVVTMEDVIFMKMKNDLSFIFHGTRKRLSGMYLQSHQRAAGSQRRTPWQVPPAVGIFRVCIRNRGKYTPGKRPGGGSPIRHRPLHQAGYSLRYPENRKKRGASYDFFD